MRPRRSLTTALVVMLTTIALSGTLIVVLADHSEQAHRVFSAPAPTPEQLAAPHRPVAHARVVPAPKSHHVISEHVIRRPRIGHLARPKAVALTFDDGPDRHWTRTVADLLHRHHVPATFCMIGRQIRDLAGVVRRVVRDGNALCDHTWDHDLDLRARPRGQQMLDVRQGYRAITRWAKVRPTYFRAPGGEWSRSLERVARAQDMRPLTWTVDPRDWARPGVHAIVHAVLRQLRPGGVILLHDGGGNRRQTVAALKILLHRLPRLGYHFVLPPA